MQTWTKTKNKNKTKNKLCLGRTYSPGFPLFLSGGPFFVQNIFFPQPEKVVPQVVEMPRAGFVAHSPCTAQQPSPSHSFWAEEPMQHPWLTPNMCYQSHHTTAPVLSRGSDHTSSIPQEN